MYKGICENCKNEFDRKYKTNKFCSKKCELEYKHKKYNEFRVCPICNKEFETLKSSKKKFCSLECQIRWQKETPWGIGENNPRYLKGAERTTICEWCGKIFETVPYKIKKKGVARFCSLECKREWYAKVWSQSPEWSKNRREWAVSLLENGDTTKTETLPQITINKILDNLGIKYINEKSFVNCAVDNYLTDYNLILEIMGTYWHCDNRTYERVRYENQKQRIKMDKIKHSYIKNNYDIEILYLWESDIRNNSKLCEKLILKYIANTGKIENYHSMNYAIEGESIIIKPNLISPYMEWGIDELNTIVVPELRQKTSKKQPDKWITFNCEFCGKEKEQLISHYNKSEHHFCSLSCSSKYYKNINSHDLYSKNN